MDCVNQSSGCSNKATTKQTSIQFLYCEDCASGKQKFAKAHPSLNLFDSCGVSDASKSKDCMNIEECGSGAQFFCKECNLLFCPDCYDAVHKIGKMKTHEKLLPSQGNVNLCSNHANDVDMYCKVDANNNKCKKICCPGGLKDKHMGHQFWLLAEQIEVEKKCCEDFDLQKLAEIVEFLSGKENEMKTQIIQLKDFLKRMEKEAETITARKEEIMALIENQPTQKTKEWLAYHHNVMAEVGIHEPGKPIVNPTPQPIAVQPTSNVDSVILDATKLSGLNGFFGKTVNLKLVFRGSRDGINASYPNRLAQKAFHVKCNSIGPNLTVVKTERGNVIGGFTTQNWTGNGQWKSDNHAFVFSLAGPKGTQKFKAKPDKSAIFCYPNCGPHFGYYDLLIWPGDGNCFSYDDQDYYEPHGNLDGGENSQFKVAEIEVFQVTNF